MEAEEDDRRRRHRARIRVTIHIVRLMIPDIHSPFHPRLDALHQYNA